MFLVDYLQLKHKQTIPELLVIQSKFIASFFTSFYFLLIEAMSFGSKRQDL